MELSNLSSEALLMRLINLVFSLLSHLQSHLPSRSRVFLSLGQQAVLQIPVDYIKTIIRLLYCFIQLFFSLLSHLYFLFLCCFNLPTKATSSF